MKKIIFSCIVAVLLLQTLSAQVEVSILEDDPDYAQLMLQTGLSLETDFAYRTKILLELNGFYQLEQHPIAFTIETVIPITDERKKEFYPSNLSDNDFQVFSTLDAIATYNFSDETSVVPINVVLGSRTKYRASRNTKTISTTLIDGKMRKRLGARIGFFRHAQSLTDFDAIDKSIVFIDGTTLPSADNAWSSDKLSDGDDFIFTAERHLSLALGFSFHKSSGVVINTDKMGKRHGRQNMFLYADVLVNIASDIQKVSYMGRLFDLNDAVSGVELKNIGFRVGAKNVRSNVFYSIEFGQRPTYFKPSFFLAASLGYSFNRNI